jgi:hypothetical protein
MAVTIGKIRCYFCATKDGIMESVCDYGIYGDVGRRIHYHPQCLQMVELSPEAHGNIMMDKAIFINERRKECMGFNDDIEKVFKKKVERLKRNNFERMFPRWVKK